MKSVVNPGRSLLVGMALLVLGVGGCSRTSDKEGGQAFRDGGLLDDTTSYRRCDDSDLMVPSVHHDVNCGKDTSALCKAMIGDTKGSSSKGILDTVHVSVVSIGTMADLVGMTPDLFPSAKLQRSIARAFGFADLSRKAGFSVHGPNFDYLHFFDSHPYGFVPTGMDGGCEIFVKLKQGGGEHVECMVGQFTCDENSMTRRRKQTTQQ